jgi:hypothetical protein
MVELDRRFPLARKGIFPGNALFVPEVDRLRCPRCDWEGDKKDSDAKEGGLIFYDHFFRDQFKIEMTRMNYFCPKCGNMIESRRVIPGMPEDMTPQ